MRVLQTIFSQAGVAAGTTTNVSLQPLATSIAGRPANLVGLTFRLAKSAASTVRTQGTNVVIRDNSEPLFDATLAEMASQERERGEAVHLRLGAASAADVVVATWRPGYGSDTRDAGHAAGLFVAGGGITITTPVDGAITYTIEVVAQLDASGPLRIAPRAITRALAATVREIPGDFLLARLRDAGHVDANTYSVRTSEREILTGVSGATIRGLYEKALGPAGDPVLLTAELQWTLASPNMVRAILSDFSYGSGEKMPPMSRLPRSAGNVSLVAGFAGAPIVTYIYPRTRGEAESLARTACDRAGVAYAAPMPPLSAAPELYPFLPLRLESP